MAVQNNVVGTLFVQIQPVAPGFNAQVQAIINNAAQNAQVNVNVNANTGQAEQGISRINQSLIAAAANTALFEEAVRRISSTVGFVVNQFGGLFDTLVRARLGFENLLGERAGGALLEEVRELAKETPFTNNVLVKYSQQLLAVGLAADQIIPTLQSVGDLIFTVGGDTQTLERVLYAMSQVQATGRLLGQDARQFQDALIPIQRYIADYLDVSIAQVQELQRLGEISSEVVFAALRQAAEPVAGALQNANQTISGSLEILSGTFQTFIQDQPVLQEIFADIVAGINSITETIESEEFAERFNNLFDAIGASFEKLEPVFEGIRTAFGAGFLTAFDAITSGLEIFAEVLDMIPEPVLEAVGIFFVALATLKLPTAFLGYVAGLAKLFAVVGTGQLGTGINNVNKGIQGTGTAAAASTRSLNSFIGNINKAALAYNALGVAAAVAGVAVTQASGDNRGGQIAGGALTGAGAGAALGTAIAPGIGTAIGAAGGAILGGVQAYFTTARNEIDSFQEELSRRGAEAAEDFVRTFQAEFGNNFTSSEATGAFFSQYDNLNADREQLFSDLDALKAQRDALQADLDTVVTELQNTAISQARADQLVGEKDAIISNIDEVNSAIDRSRGKLGELRATRQGIFDSEAGQQYNEYYSNIASTLELINREVDLLGAAGLASEDTFARIGAVLRGDIPGGTTGSLLTGGIIVNTTEDLGLLNGALEQFGITVEDLSTLSVDNLITEINVALGQTVSEADAATLAVSRFVLAMQGAENVVSSEDLLAGTVGIFQAQAEAYAGALEAQREVNSLFGDFFTENLDTLSLERVAPTLQAISDAGLGILANASQQAQVLRAEIYAQTGDLALADSESIQAANNAIAQSFEALQTTLGITDREFEALLVEAGLWDAYSTAFASSTGVIQTYFDDLAVALGVTSDELAELVGLQGDITEFTLISYDADTQAALDKLNELKILQDEIRTDSSFLGVNFSNQVAQDIRNLEGQIVDGLSAFNPDLSEQQAAIDAQNKKNEEDRLKEQERQAKEREAAAKKLADEARRALEEYQRAQEAWARKLEQVSDSLNGAITSAVEGIQTAAREWTNSIRERTQFERSVSTGSLTRNANRQANDIAETNAQIQGLLARGVSEQVLSALDINNVDDLRQLRRLAGSTDAELFALSSAVGRRDTAAVTLAENRQQQQLQNTITAAIIAAAQTLGLNRDQAREAAASIAAQITVTGATDPESLARIIEQQLLGLPAAAALRP